MLCTGVSAKWCPVHGDCTCPNNNGDYDSLNDDDCPLHSASSQHAEEQGIQTAFGFVTYADFEQGANE